MAQIINHMVLSPVTNEATKAIVLLTVKEITLTRQLLQKYMEKKHHEYWNPILPWNHRLQGISQSVVPRTPVGHSHSLWTQCIMSTNTHPSHSQPLTWNNQGCDPKHSFVSRGSLRKALKDLKRSGLHKRTKRKETWKWTEVLKCVGVGEAPSARSPEEEASSEQLE